MGLGIQVAEAQTVTSRSSTWRGMMGLMLGAYALAFAALGQSKYQTVHTPGPGVEDPQARVQSAESRHADEDLDLKPGEHTLAVLPLANLNPGTETDWLGPAAADTLATKLAGLPQLVLVERTQIRKVLEEQDFQKLDLAEPSTAVKVGRVLGVERIVIGSYASQGGDVLFNVRVVDVASAQVLNTASLTGKREAIFDTFFALAEAVIQSFDRKVAVVDSRPVVQSAPQEERVEVKPEDRAQMKEIGATRPEAFEAYGRGLVAPTVEEQVQQFSLAIQYDDRYTPAYLARGDALCTRDPRLAIRDYDRVVRIQPNYIYGYYKQGRTYERIGDSQRAVVSYRRIGDRAPSRSASLIDRLRRDLTGRRDSGRTSGRVIERRGRRDRD